MAAKKTSVSYVPSSREEVLQHSLWSTRRLGAVAIANTELSFFNYVAGQTVDTVATTIVDTNMKKANAVEQPNRFYIKNIYINIFSSILPTLVTPVTGSEAAVNNVLNIGQNAKFTLQVSNKEVFVEAPILSLLANEQNYTYAHSDAATNGYSANLGFVKKKKSFKNAILLPSEISFSVKLNFGADAAALLTAAPTKIVVVLQGQLIRLAEM